MPLYDVMQYQIIWFALLCFALASGTHFNRLFCVDVNDKLLFCSPYLFQFHSKKIITMCTNINGYVVVVGYLTKNSISTHIDSTFWLSLNMTDDFFAVKLHYPCHVGFMYILNRRDRTSGWAINGKKKKRSKKNEIMMLAQNVRKFFGGNVHTECVYVRVCFHKYYKCAYFNLCS